MAQRLLPEYLNPDVPEVRPVADERITALLERVTVLETEVAILKDERLHLHQESLRVIGRLLSPLYKSLKPIFGELEAADVDESPRTPTGKQAQWESVKQRLQPRHREVIDILLLQGEMGRKQIASAIKMDYTNCCKNVIGPLIRQGWLVESGGKIALKNL